MLKHRVIPALLLHRDGLVKTRKFADPTYVGDPLNAIKIFNEKEVDELLLLDISATREGHGPDFDLIADFATECFMPFGYGGGVSTLEHAERLFRLGVEKVCLQTATRRHLGLVEQIAGRYGSQAVVGSVDVKADWKGTPQLYWAADRTTDADLKGHLDRLQSAGVGEIVLNSVDRDGMMSGMDLKLIRRVASDLKVPLVALGGVGELDHIREAIDAGASAVAAGSFFVFHGKRRAVLITYPAYGALEDLLST
ncbi:AglZ/HisF2 family acetamidino modification protein [Brevundimonas halotolerans]|uniref:Imidazole glycerol phosphate synthase subunit HisF n=1 Tax=Brevundimonas halotolerans TaxID=69670 RepID=A0A7W9A4S4_9CAUL|nr:AglZ/HisF2 family acetamidino modification protein [Brevundimonas halotolerans]MBB5661409.1 cyclase [Brevundimonas halotolerans]